MPRITLAALAAQVATLTAALEAAQAAPVAPRVASAHWKAKDLACPRSCGKSFRTAKGLAWHMANVAK